MRHSGQRRPEPRDLETSLLLSLLLSGGLYFWNQHMLALIDNTQRTWKKPFFFDYRDFYNRKMKKDSILPSTPTALCVKRNSNVRFVLSYRSGCSDGMIGLNQICCGCKCVVVDFRCPFIRTCLWRRRHNGAPQGASL